MQMLWVCTCFSFKNRDTSLMSGVHEVKRSGLALDQSVTAAVPFLQSDAAFSPGVAMAITLAKM